jgi:lauroyl/myristoyl acyltransferase
MSGGLRSLSPEADARHIMSRVAADLEAVVRAHPTQWFNFYRFWKDGSAPEVAAGVRPESDGRAHAP